MTPQARKTASERLLRSHGIAVNDDLPLIEAEDEVELRSPEEVLRRLVALWAVVDKAFLGNDSETADYIKAHGLQSWLSPVELEFLCTVEPSARDTIHFSWQLEALFFIAWAAGLLDSGELPTTESSVKSILPLFPSGSELPDRLRAAIRLRSKTEVLDRADLLYRLHWTVRDAHLNAAPEIEGINGGVVQEWHRAVNWMIRYESEDDWDQVGTDT